MARCGLLSSGTSRVVEASQVGQETLSSLSKFSVNDSEFFMCRYVTSSTDDLHSLWRLQRKRHAQR